MPAGGRCGHDCPVAAFTAYQVSWIVVATFLLVNLIVGAVINNYQKVQDIEELSSVTVRIGGRPVEGGWDRVARYCGRPWSGGDDETWAFGYYDAVPSPRSDIVRPLDVLASGALHPGLTKSELTFFHDERDAITAWLEVLPEDQHLAGCEGDVLRHLAELATWPDNPASATSCATHRSTSTKGTTITTAISSKRF